MYCSLAGDFILISGVPDEQAMRLCAERGPSVPHSIKILLSPPLPAPPSLPHTVPHPSTGLNPSIFTDLNNPPTKTFPVRLLTQMIPAKNTQRADGPTPQVEVEVGIGEKPVTMSDINSNVSPLSTSSGMLPLSLSRGGRGVGGVSGLGGTGPISQHNTNSDYLEEEKEKQKESSNKRLSGRLMIDQDKSGPLNSIHTVASHLPDSPRSSTTLALDGTLLLSKTSAPSQSIPLRMPLPSLPAPSSIFNSIFSSSSRRLRAPASDPKDEDEKAVLSGEVQLHRTQTVADTAAKVGGLSLWYPLLVTDRTRQVAAMRVSSMGLIL